MLSEHMTVGTQILGLAALINSGKPGFDASYRVVQVGTGKAIEFLETAPAVGAHPVKILPYRSGKIANVSLGGTEVISGEFTGCIMATYETGGNRVAGHVCTNADTSQRAEWERQKTAGAVTGVKEYDTAGKLKPEHGTAIILCVASGVDGEINRVHVRKQRYAYGQTKAADSPFTESKFDTLYTVISAGKA